MPHAYLSKATEARSAVVADQTEGRMTSQAHAAPLLYVHPHPTAARRAATLASSGCEMHMGTRISLRPLQRRFKARKKPEWYTSTPTGLKRLKTQHMAFHGNRNGKWTPSGVPQPIHKRKLVLVKEEFDASSSGGDEGDRTPDLLTASQALSQLSYAPVRRSTIRELPRRCKDNFRKTFGGASADAGRTQE